MSGQFQVEVDWTYGMHPLIVEWVEENDIPESRIKVISETEIIILDTPRW